MKYIAGLLTIISIFCASSCHAEKIFFKDGRIESAEITSRGRNTIWVKMPGGFIGISPASIERIENDDGSMSRYDIENIVRKIQQYIGAKEYGKAVGLCDFFVGAYPNDANARYLRAMLNQKAGNNDRAREDYDFLIANDAAGADIYNNMGVIYAKEEKYDKALDFFSKAAEKRPESLAAMRNLAIAFLYNKQYSASRHMWNKILEKSPGDADAKKAIKLIDKM